MHVRFPVSSHLARAAALQDGGGSVKPERSLQDVDSVVVVIKIILCCGIHSDRNISRIY